MVLTDAKSLCLRAHDTNLLLATISKVDIRSMMVRSVGLFMRPVCRSPVGEWCAPNQRCISSRE
jgi:hypothetical protein